MSVHNLQTYRPSGKVGVSLIWKLPLVLCIVLCLVFFGTWLVASFQLIYVSPIIYFIHLFILGALANLLVRWAHIRSVSIAALSAGFIGLTALYFSWVFMLPKILSTASIEISVEVLLKNPGMLLDYIGQAGSKYTFNFLGFELNGQLLKGIWIVEAIGFILYPVYKSYLESNLNVFCEDCHQWTESQPGVVGFYHNNEKKLKTQFSTADYDFMDEAEAIFNVPMKNYYCVDAEVCVGCNDFFVLSLRLMKKATDQDKAKWISLSDKLLVDRPYFQHFLLLTNQFPGPEEGRSLGS